MCAHAKQMGVGGGLRFCTDTIVCEFRWHLHRTNREVAFETQNVNTSPPPRMRVTHRVLFFSKHTSMQTNTHTQILHWSKFAANAIMWPGLVLNWFLAVCWSYVSPVLWLSFEHRPGLRIDRAHSHTCSHTCSHTNYCQVYRSLSTGYEKEYVCVFGTSSITSPRQTQTLHPQGLLRP